MQAKSLRTTVFTLMLMAFSTSTFAKIVEYNFDINYTTVNFSGKDVQAMTVGGAIPAPTIEATVGDTLRVIFNNKMEVSSSIHWHGVLLPNDQDGVPFLNTPPIKAGTSFTFEYPVIHHGTYWYHSHTGLQEQRGVYGSIVFHPQEGERVEADEDVVVVLSDWIDENPNQVMHNLKKADDYYALKKGSVQSWLKVFQHGTQAIKSRLNGAWVRMSPMDISDVGYDAFLVNGKQKQKIPDVKAGDKVRLRLINAAASSYFNVEYSGGEMIVVAADGVDVEPLVVSRQRIAIAETFDVIVTLSDDRAYEVRATSEDGTGYSSIILGEGVLVKAADIPPPNPFLMDHSMHSEMAEVNHNEMEGVNHAAMGHVLPPTQEVPQAQDMAEYELLRAVKPTNFDADNPKREVLLELTGDMERYAWSFDNKVLSEDSKILIRKGETVQFVLTNKTMMHHPIHLHGHFFRVLNGQGDYSPLKHTVNVPPMQTVTIEFLANEEKDWIFHCHNLYHMKAGMARVVSYQGTTQSTAQSLAPLFSDRHWFYFADLGLQTHFISGELRVENTRNAVNLEYERGYPNKYGDEYEAEITYERYIDRFLELYIGGEFEKEDDETENTVIAGVQYVLPLLVGADLRIDNEGDVRLELGSELQLTDRVSFEWRVNTDSEYRMQLEYEVNKHLSLTASHDDQFDGGLGLEMKF